MSSIEHTVVYCWEKITCYKEELTARCFSTEVSQQRMATAFLCDLLPELKSFVDGCCFLQALAKEICISTFYPLSGFLHEILALFSR